MDATATMEDLRAFAEDESLAKLKEAQSHFNIFEAIGTTHKELSHSDFLAFLLNPMQNHGLADEFTKQLLRRAIPNLAEFDSFEDVVVRREHRYTDILVEDEQRKICVIIENKIWSPEAPGQLAEYWRAITVERPGWSTYGVFLTPKGLRPIEEVDKERYSVLSYTTVRGIMRDVLATKCDHLDLAVLLTIRHYIDMLGRFIVGNADAEELTRKLYFKHRSAINLMHRALWREWIKSHLEHLIGEDKRVEQEESTLEHVRFGIIAWDAARGLGAGTSKTKSYPMLYFTFYNLADSLTLHLWIGPAAPTDAREKLRQIGEQSIPPFCKPGKWGDYHYIYLLEFLTRKDYETCSNEDMTVRIEKKWQQFQAHLTEMLQTLEAAKLFGSATG